MPIRPATPADLPAITEIYQENVLNGVATYELTPPDLEEMKRRFSAIREDGYPWLAAEEGGSLLGYAYAGPFRARPAYRWLVEDSIYLAPEARGRGIGGALLATLLDTCTALGFRQMTAIIGGAHPASIGVHRKAGFQHCGVMTGTGYKHGRWLDTVIMQKALGDGNVTDPDMGSYPGTLFKT